MEPLAALSLAAGIAQFLDFGSKLIKKTRELAEAETTPSLDHLFNVTSDLVRIDSSLRSKLKSTKSAPSGQEQISTPCVHIMTLLLIIVFQAFLDLINKCNGICEEPTESLGCTIGTRSPSSTRQRPARQWIYPGVGLSHHIMDPSFFLQLASVPQSIFEIC